MKYFDKSGKEYFINPSKEIARGGEGMIIEIGKHTAAKIYFPNRTPLSETKLDQLSGLPLRFIKPLVILYDTKKKPAGFTMSLLEPGSFPIHSTFNSGFCNKNSLDDQWKLDIIKLLKEGMIDAHRDKIIIGDFNGFNLLAYQNKGLFFIDVDSYETPSYKHSGILFDDIRDHLYHGKVSKESDYFCLAVLSFYMLTYVHPFKGVHKKFPMTSERMIQKIPIFDNDKNLIVPKCYKPITNQFLMEQFIKIFKRGERFPLELVPGLTVRIIQPSTTISIETVELIIKEMHSSSSIRYVKASDTFCVVVEKSKITVFNVPVKSVFNTFIQIPVTNDITEIFLNNNYVFALKKDSIGVYDKTGTYLPLEQLDPNYLWHNQYENILLIGYEDYMMKFFLDDVIFQLKKIRNSKESIFGKRFTKYQGLVQHVSGTDFIFYNGRGILNTVKFPFKLHDVIQRGNFGIAEYFDDKNNIKYAMFTIKGLEVVMNGTQMDRMSYIAFKNDYAIVPENDALTFYRPSDFGTIAKYECKLIDEDTQLMMTNSGILAFTGDKLLMINKK